MRRNFTKSFKIQAIEKALSRSEETTVGDIASLLNMSSSTLSKWIMKAKRREFVDDSPEEIMKITQDRRPQDWTLEERFNMVFSCSSLKGEALSQSCREQGIYPHHVEQWKRDFTNGENQNSNSSSRSEIKILKNENKALKKELNRKEKALAETAALLVLKKKVNEIWGTDEDNSQ